jgi:integrase
MQARYQYGSLTVRKRKKGPDVWQFRWMENGNLKSVLIGTVERYPNRADAERAVEPLRVKINAESPQTQFHRVTIEGLVERYKAKELPARYSTRASYLAYLNNHIVPRWGSTHVDNVRALDVETWLRCLSLAPKTKAHIRSLMHVLFQCARRWELTQANPIDLVRQSARRKTVPRILSPEEFCTLLANLGEPYRSMVLVAACLGLRASEVVGLQWQDFDWEALIVTIRRGVVHGRLGETKTEASEKPVPLDPELAKEILAHRERSVHIQPTDYVFAGDSGNPRWQETILADHIKPAAVKAGITGKVGWHNFRHTYSTLLRALGTDVKVQQELLRHADVSTTLNIYTQAVSQQKREAASKVARLLLRRQKEEGPCDRPLVVPSCTRLM